MAQTIQIKRSTATAAPATLANGELAYSHVGTDGKLFIGRPGGAVGDVDAIGGKYYVDRSETAYGWGDHSAAGYLVATAASYNNAQWDTAYTYSQVGHLPLAGGALTGAVTTTSTFDGRDVSVDGAKLDTIATSANNYTLANLNAHLAGGVGNIVTSGYIRGPAAMVIDPAAHGDETGALTILGDLIVEGTTTTINSTVVEIADERVVVNREQTGTPTVALVAGLEVERGTSTNAYLLWREANSGWYVSDGGAADFELLHANNWSTAYTGVVDGGSF
jgi:hypothetical protein